MQAKTTAAVIRRKFPLGPPVTTTATVRMNSLKKPETPLDQWRRRGYLGWWRKGQRPFPGHLLLHCFHLDQQLDVVWNAGQAVSHAP
jgi:hypothetical protein